MLDADFGKKKTYETTKKKKEGGKRRDGVGTALTYRRERLISYEGRRSDFGNVICYVFGNGRRKRKKASNGRRTRKNEVSDAVISSG